ncbi:adenosylcobinamide amidohydrolase [Pseudoruegeria sp. HB172150]|uniref:adenosylcobinamide amidohydrolase n=1 Tax=Pseudoruegeria sp. HB172150 TaxID=2721164 RepID=UPI001554E734|nr:adenosylcobinamide amidohydrolase [Pseudoruegeria sp. HB172150]
MSGIILDRPWLELDLGAELQVLSWVINRPGPVMASKILWREVCNADLHPGLDVSGWVKAELDHRGVADCPCFLTSRDLRRHVVSEAVAGSATVRCVATVGLSNAERVGARMDYADTNWGTINIAVQLGTGMKPAAMLEAMTIVAQARTLAVVEAGPMLPGGPATGTGTDCIALAAPKGEGAYAGLHTDLGEAIGRATYEAIRRGTEDWMRERHDEH